MLLFLTGQQRAGKDTVADWLQEKHGFKKISLAAPVYWVARNVFDMEGKDRGLLIEIGQKLREIDDAVFVKWVLRQAKNYANVVVPDVRFPVEWEYLKNAGGIAVRVAAPKEIRAQRPGYNPEFEDHPTEHMLDDYECDYVIQNTLDFMNLYVTVDALVSHLKGGE